MDKDSIINLQEVRKDPLGFLSQIYEGKLTLIALR